MIIIIIVIVIFIIIIIIIIINTTTVIITTTTNIFKQLFILKYTFTCIHMLVELKHKWLKIHS